MRTSASKLEPTVVSGTMGVAVTEARLPVVEKVSPKAPNWPGPALPWAYG